MKLLSDIKEFLLQFGKLQWTGLDSSSNFYLLLVFPVFVLTSSFFLWNKIHSSQFLNVCVSLSLMNSFKTGLTDAIEEQRNPQIPRRQTNGLNVYNSRGIGALPGN